MELSKQNILSTTSSGLDFYRFVLPHLEVTGHKSRNIRNPFYDDNKSGLSIFLSDDQWLFNDFGNTDYKGDVFNFAGHYYRLDPVTDFPEILKRMNFDLNLNLQNSYPSKMPVPISMPVLSKPVQGEASTLDPSKLKLRSNFFDFEIDYWSRYGISLELLKRFQVMPVAEMQPKPGFILNSIPANPIFAYQANATCSKIYQPYSTKFKFQWVGNHPSDWIFGYKQLPSTAHSLFITGGEKDVLSLSQRNVNAITLNSETATLTAELFSELTSRFANIYILYDADSTGMRQSELICKKYGIPRFILPAWVSEKGGKDISDYFALGGNFDNDDLIGEEFSMPTNLGNPEHELILPASFDKIPRITHVRSAQQRLQDAASQPPIVKLLDIFFHTGELTILFADTGVGKSVFAVAAGDAIAAGKPFMGLINEAPPQTVLYYDFELSDKQFQKRYSDDKNNPYQFSPNFYVSNLSLNELTAISGNTNFDDLIAYNIERDVIEKQASVVIIDNLTFLKTQPMQEQDTALLIMKKLTMLKRQYNLSMLVLSHTPKIYNTSPLNITHLQGSKHISNFADGVFCIGKCSNDPAMRYLKQVKPSRSAELIYDTENVILMELLKTDKCLLFEFRGYDSEFNHLVQKTEANKELKARARDLRNDGKSLVEIAELLGKSKSSIGRWLKTE
jgi:hypothetical protein